MTRDERKALYSVVQAFTPNLTQNQSPQDLDDESASKLVADALAMQDAEITDLRAQLDEALRQLDLRQAGDSAEPAAQAAGVAPEQISALLRHHRISFNEALPEAYTDARGVTRRRWKTVPRPASAEDVQASRDTGDAGVSVVLRDGKRHLLPWLREEVAS